MALSFVLDVEYIFFLSFFCCQNCCLLAALFFSVTTVSGMVSAIEEVDFLEPLPFFAIITWVTKQFTGPIWPLSQPVNV
jgi:hypothetical protein